MRIRIAKKGAVLAALLGGAALPAQDAADAVQQQAPVLPDASCVTPDLASSPRPSEAQPVLVDGFGHAGLEADSENPQARAWFEQGVRLIWAFDEAEAIRAFAEAQRHDPECAMCFLGEAWARSPTLNLRPRTEELKAARAAAERAAVLAEGLSERDRVLVSGMMLRTRQAEAFDADGYAAFMEAAALRMPEDDTIAILAADARMQASEEMDPDSLSQRLLERVLARRPDHSGAIHFYIHLTDWIDRQYLAEPYAERLARIAPAASHLVHMPSHTFYGVGRYGDAAQANVAAIAADRAYERAVRPPPSTYRRLLMRHNMQFAINSALARGDGRTALSVSNQYRRAFLTDDVQPTSRLLGSATYYAQGLHGELAEVLALPEPEQAVDRLMRHYARGEALARASEAEAVAVEAAGIAALREGVDAPGLGRGGGVLAEIFQHVLEGRAAMLGGDADAAEAAYRKALQAQRSADFGFDPPLFWYSVRRSLAAALIVKGDHEGARNQLYASLRRWPQDPLALYALSLADRALGEEQSAERNLARARRGWAGDLADITLTRI